MPKVTNLTPQKKDPRRYNLFIDDKFFCGIDESLILTFKLKKGIELDKETLEKIFSQSKLNKIYNRALDYLARRPRSEKEMRDYIKEKITKYKIQISNDEDLNSTIESLVDRLKSFNYINDLEFAKWWVEQRIERSKPSGLIKIKSELFKKGVDKSIVEKAWEELAPSEKDLAKAHFEKVASKYDLTNQKDKKRLVNYMLRQGFKWSIIKDMLK